MKIRLLHIFGPYVPTKDGSNSEQRPDAGETQGRRSVYNMVLAQVPVSTNHKSGFLDLATIFALNRINELRQKNVLA
jgi:hypothetical protein